MGAREPLWEPGSGRAQACGRVEPWRTRAGLPNGVANGLPRLSVPDLGEPGALGAGGASVHAGHHLPQHLHPNASAGYQARRCQRDTALHEHEVHSFALQLTAV